MPAPLTNAQQERLVILIEECSEIQKIATKVLRFGWRPTAYEREYDNVAMLAAELGDLKIVVQLMIEEGDVPLSAINTAAEKKYTTINDFLHFNKINLEG